MAKNMQKIRKICKQYAGFDGIALYCMQYAKCAKQMCTTCKICNRHFQYAEYALPTLLMTLFPVLLVTASHGRIQRAVPGFISHPWGFFRRLRGGMQENAAGFCRLRAPVP